MAGGHRGQCVLSTKEIIRMSSFNRRLARNAPANISCTAGGAPPPPATDADASLGLFRPSLTMAAGASALATADPRRVLTLMPSRPLGIAAGACAITLLLLAPLRGAEVKVDLSKERVGRPPQTFEPMVGTWVVAEDGPGSNNKVIMVDGRPWVASKDNPTKLLIESARRLYGTSNEELMDNAKQFAYFPVAVLKGVDNFTNGTISVKFKTIAGDADRASGILFNVKPNGDWLAIRYNDTENNVALWEFHTGMRRNMRFADPREKFMLDRAAWHELKMTVKDADFKVWLDGELALEYTLGSMPGPGRNGAPPNPDLIPANNPVLQPPVKGKIGLWAKTDTTSYFKDYVVTQ